MLLWGPKKGCHGDPSPFPTRGAVETAQCERSAEDLNASEVGEGLLSILRFLMEESVAIIKGVSVNVAYSVLSEAEWHLSLVTLDFDTPRRGIIETHPLSH